MGTHKDSDDDLEIVTVVSSVRQTLAAAEAIVQQIDSDDDQPLGVLRQSLQKALTGSQPVVPSPESLHEPHGAQQVAKLQPANKLVSQKAVGTGNTGGSAAGGQHEGPRSEGPAIDKENIAHIHKAAASGQHDTEIDLDNWVMQPLQRRRRQRTPGAAQPAATRSGSQGVMCREQAPQQVPSAQHSQQQQQHDLAARFTQTSPAEADHSAAAEASQAKRQRRSLAARMTGIFTLGDDDYDADPCFEPDSTAAAPAKTAARKRAADGVSVTAASAAGTGRGSGRVRLTAEERAAQKAEEKARKEAEKIAAKLAKQAEAAVAKAAKRFETFHARKMNGSFQEYESVLVMDQVTAGTVMGLAIAAELDRRKTIAWQVVSTLPLSNKWPGCCVFGFKRRKLSETDEHMIKTAVTSRVEGFVEDVAPPYIQLVFHEPSAFLSELQHDRLAGLLKCVQAAHPDFTLGVMVLGLKPYVQRLDNQQMRQGAASHFDWRRVSSLLLGLHLSTPGLQLRLLSKQDEAATHVINTARVIGQQPYSVENQLEACGGAGPGAASKAAAANMTADLGPATCDFAVSTLGKMHGMGGNKAWAVAKAYPSFGALIAGFQRAAAVPASGGCAPELLLADLVEPAAGKAKPRRVGPAMSRRLHLLLTCEDPDAIVEGDGDAAGE